MARSKKKSKKAGKALVGKLAMKEYGAKPTENALNKLPRRKAKKSAKRSRKR